MSALCEKELAQTAKEEEVTLFDKIVRREIPSDIIYEDDKTIAFRDISPTAPVHFLVVPKDRDGLTQLSKAEERHVDLLGHLLLVAQKVAKQEGLDEGFRVVINDGKHGCTCVGGGAPDSQFPPTPSLVLSLLRDSGQSIYHIHLHVIGKRQLNWPPG